MSEYYPEPSPLSDRQLEYFESDVGGTQLMYAAAYEIRKLRAALEKAEAELLHESEQEDKQYHRAEAAERSRDEAVKELEQCKRTLDIAKSVIKDSEWISESKAGIEHLNIALAASKEVADEIKSIMAVYREQDARPQGIGTPGGLEHMGDVWRLLAKWDRILLTPEAANGGEKWKIKPEAQRFRIR